MSTLSSWLSQNKLSGLEEALKTYGEISDLSDLKDLENESDVDDFVGDLKKAGISTIKRKKLKKCILELINEGKPGPNKADQDEEEEKKAPPAKPKYYGKKKEVSLIFVGETGVGKTTLLKSLADFINDVPFKRVRHTPKPQASGLSQTQHTAEYPLSNDEWAVNIIDTPGIGDTSGVKKDQDHMENIIDFVGKFGDFNAVCILLKRGTTRLTSRMRYVVGELKSNMPKDVENNFIVIMTRSDVPIPDADTMKVIKGLHLPTGNIIPINNGAYEELDLTDFEPGSPMVKIAKDRQRNDYASNHKYLQMLLETAVKFERYQGHKMLQLKLKRDRLREDVGLLKMTIDDSFRIEKALNEQIAAFKAAKSEADLNKAYDNSSSHTEYEYYKETGKITTSCNACSRACHIDCSLSYGTDLNRCSCAGSNGYCKQCGCSITSHTHLGWRSKETTVYTEDVDEDMKYRHMSAQQKKQKCAKRQAILEKKKRRLEKKRDTAAKSIREKYKELEQIAIIGYNESFERYMEECKAAVDKDPTLTLEEKQKKSGIFQAALDAFRFFKKAIGVN